MLRSILPLLTLLLSAASIQSQCNAAFTWEQLPNTLQVHFHSTSTSEHDIVSYQWNFGDGHTGDGSNPYHTYDQPGTYNVCLIITDNVGCVSDVCHEVVVAPINAECNAEFTWEQIPNTLQIHYHSTSTSNHDIVSYQWNFGDGQTGDGANPYHTYANAGTYVVCLIITDNVGCVSDVCHEVTVNAPSDCHAGFEWEQYAGTLEVDFINTSTSDHDIISYQWNFGDGQTGDGANPTHAYEEPGTYLVCLIITNSVGCVSDVCHEVTVAPVSGECNADFNWEQLPNTLQLHFHNTATSNHDIISYVWNFGDGHTGDGPNPYHTYEEPGTYVVCLTITDNSGCVDDICHEVVVEAIGSECEAGFNWEVAQGNNLEIHFHSTSTSNHDIVSYHWIFGDGSEGDGANPTHVYDSAGVYVVCLIITDNTGCVSDVCHEVVVGGGNSECHAEFNWEQLNNSLQIHFHSTSTSNHDIVSYLWNFGDGHTGDGSNPYHTYEEPGTYLVCLTITDNSGCVDDVCHEIVVEAVGSECNASFTWETAQGNNLEIHFHSTSTSNHDIVSYHWIFGDGTEGDGANPTHVYDSIGVYVVCLVITDNTGCVDDICHEVHVEAPAPCHASFNWEIAQGNNLEVHFHSTSTSGHDIVSYHWIFGDGSEGDGANPTHVYDSAGTYLVCLIITDNSGCVSDICHEVHVGESEAQCNASFTWEAAQGNSLEIHFHSTSTSNHDIVSYQWNFGDGHTGDGANPTHVYDAPGTYVVCLIITDNAGCVSDVCHEVHVGAAEACNASFTWDLDDNDVYHFFNHSTGGTPHATWLWTFGDGHSSTQENPEHHYDEPGIYTVCLIMTDTIIGCVDDVCHNLTYNMGWEELGFNGAQNTLSTAAPPPSGRPQDFKVISYNNPATGELWIDYTLSSTMVVRFEIYDLTGNRMISRFSGEQVNGKHRETIDINQLHPGMYILMVTTGAERKTMRLNVSR